MKIPFLTNKKKFNNIYLGILLKEEEGVIFIFSLENNKILLKEEKKFLYTNSWENLVKDIDETIFEFEKYFDNEKIKTIFFLYSHFINEKTNSIKQPYLNKIKEIIDNLDLETIGYIECFEGATYLFQKKYNDLLNAIFLEIDKTQLTTIFYKAGKLDYKITVSRTDNIIDDLLKAIESYPLKTVLPPRIIIYDSDNLDNIAEKIITYKFDKQYFVQLPKIDILKPDDIYQSLIKIFEEQLIQQLNLKTEEALETNNQFGFYIGEDISENKEIKNEEKHSFNFNFKKPNFGFILNFFNKINLNEKVIFFLGLCLIIISLFVIELFFHKAQLIIYLPYQKIEKNINKSINYQEKKLNLELTSTIQATGKNFIGEKAKGSVIIHNFDDKEKNFSKGTIIETNGLKFLLDNDVKVASATLTPDGSAKLPGKATVSITAEEIGENYNLAKNQRFKIADLAQTVYFAINENNLTGGTKRKITTFSSLDKNNLEKKVFDQLKNQNKNTNLDNHQEIIKELTKINLVNKDFSKEVGEEAQTVELKAKGEVVYIVYDKFKLIEELKKQIAKDLDKDYQLTNNLKIDIKKAEIKNHQLSLNLSINSKAVLKIDEDQLKSLISGKHKNSLEKILKEKFKIVGFSLFFENQIPLINNYLPWLKNNITIRLET